MDRNGSFDTVKVSKVEGRAGQFMVAEGSVRQDDLDGNDGDDTAADLGRLSQNDEVINPRRALLRAPSSRSTSLVSLPWMIFTNSWLLSLRLKLTAMGKGGTAPDAMTWDKGGIFITCSSTLRIIVDHVSLLGPLSFLNSSWCGLSSPPITHEDVAVWPVSVNILLELQPSWPFFIGLKERDG